MDNRNLVAAVLCVVSSFPAWGQIPDEPAIRLSLNERLNLVLSSNGFETPGVDIHSESGSLVPMPPGDLLADPSPFSLLLANNRNQLTLANLGTLTKIDGDVTLNSRWDSGGERDIQFYYGVGSTPIGPYGINAADYEQCPDCLPQIKVGLNENLQFKLSGVGQKLQNFSLNSHSASLLPGDSAAPFASFGANTTSQVDFDSAASPVVLDGDITLDVGWNEYIGGRDVRYQYETAADGVQGPQQLGVNDYPPRPFIPTQLNAYVDASDKLVLVGSGHPLRRMSFGSESGSLVPSPDAGPFDSLGSNTENKIDFLSPTRGTEVVLEGSLRLGAGWNPSGQRDIEFDYSIAGDARDEGLFRIPSTNYLAAGRNPNTIRRAEPRPRFELGLNEDAKFVISSDGRSLQALRINSAANTLVPADSPEPFQKTLVNESSAVWYQTFGNEVAIDGSVALSSGWDVTTPDVNYSYFSRDGVGLSFDMGADAYTACRDCPIPRIDVDLDDNQNFVITGTGHKLANLQIASPARAALIPATDASPFTSLTENTSSRIAFEAGADNPVTLDGSVTLSAGWNIRTVQRDVKISYDLADRDRPESFELPFRAYPTAPRYPGISVRVNNDNRFVLQGSGQPLTAFALSSNTDSLVPGDTAAPFETLGENTRSRIEFASPNSVVTLDGSVTLDASWNPIFPRQVQYQYTTLERSSESSTRTIPNRNYPARVTRISDTLRMELDENKSIVLFGKEAETLGVDIQSPSGSLIPGGDASPFSTFLSNTAEQVTLGTLGDAVTIDGRVTLDVKWDENGAGDINYFYGEGGESQGPFQILSHFYTGGSCFNCFGLIEFEEEQPNAPGGGGFRPPGITPVEGIIVDGRIVLRTDQPIQVAGVDLQSAAGLLVPVPDPPGAAPFTFFLANTPNQITWGNLGSTVLIDGVFETEAGYTGDPTTGDLQAFWGDGPTPVAIGFAILDSVADNVPPPVDPLAPVVDPSVVAPPVVDPGISFVDLSDVKLDITDQQTLAIRGSGQAVSQLVVESPSRGLVPNQNGQNAAGPFATLEELNSDDGQVLLFSTGRSVVLDGVLNLGVGWSDDFSGPRDEFLENLFTDVTGQVTTPGGLTEELEFYEPFDTGFDLILNEEGQLVLLGNGQAVGGINLVSESGSLIPAVSGDLAADAGPFSFFLSNNENQITLGNLGATVEINELVLDVGLDAADLASSDLIVEIGVGGDVVRFAVGDVIVPPGNEVIPEPQSCLMLGLGIVLLFAFRKSRPVE